MNQNDNPEPDTTPKYRIAPLAENARTQDWVTLVSCGNVLEADMLRSHLESAGLPVFIPDEHLMAASGLHGTYGFVRVQVRPADYEAARDLLCAAGDAVAD